MLIDPEGGTEGRVYVSGIWSNTTRKVARRVASAVGDAGATSGANSGIHRYLSVSQVDVIAAATPSCAAVDCLPHVISNTTNGEPSVIGGDSGGPVFFVRTDDRVDARGVIASGNTTVPCPAYRFHPGTITINDRLYGKCFQHTAFFPLGRVLNEWGGLTLETMS